MRIVCRILGILTFLLTTYHLSLLTSPAYASGEFQTDYKVSYIVVPNGRTNVTQNITLKNKTANFYADKFELKIGSTKIDSVKAQSSAGPMQTDVKFQDNVTVITVQFNQRVIGLDKTFSWSLDYSSSELATKSGQIWEVSIPRLADSTDIASYEASVSVPASFGSISFAVPAYKTTSSNIQTQTFTFDKDQLTQSGIAMSFGQKQVFSYTFNYFLENKNLTNQYIDLPLPPDNNYQKIVLEKINPPPINVFVDSDGNFLARYKLAPKENLNVVADGSVEVFSGPFRNIDSKLTQEEKSRYTEPQNYWETQNSIIKEKAQQLKTPKQIYDFVTTYLSYNEKRLSGAKLERLGAAKAATDPKNAVCMEFTDLFIAIARAAGIPAREVEGYAYTQNERLRPLSLTASQGDLLHAWPEYWDDNKGWIQVDPTWGSTSGGLDYFNKLDFNHITFIQRGVNSTYPIPPGGYKRQEDLGKKSVFVQFAQELPSPTQDAELSINLPDKIIAGIPARITASVTNVGTSSIFAGEALLDSGNLRITSLNPVKITLLPPYSKQDLSYTIQTKSFLTKEITPLTLKFASFSISKKTQVLPIYYLFVSPPFVLSVAIAAALLTIGFYFYNKHRKHKLSPSVFS